MRRSQLVFGVTFVALGLVLLLDRAGELDAGDVIGTWWPTVLLLLGLATLALPPRNLAGGVFITAMGLAFLGWTAGGWDTLSVLWPLLLVAAGLALLFRRPRPSRVPQVVTDDDLVAVFEPRSVRVPAGPLRKLDLTTIFADLDVDLRATSLARPTTVEVLTIFGDAELVIPAGWEVTTSGPRIFGDVDIAAPAEPGTGTGPGSGGGVLHLEVMAVFGDISVRRGALDAVGG